MPLSGLLLCLLLGAGCAQPATESGYPTLFADQLARTQVRVEGIMQQGMEVPTPKDMAGGYTHEVHKQNWYTLRDAGALYRLTGDEKYAVFVRDALLKYAAAYPDWPTHPTNRSYATGRIFWQCLNDANWLVYVSQGYGDIYDWLDADTRNQLNQELFRPMADFLSVENPQFFNRIHNHSTWGSAAVGMIGLVMDDDELVDRALNGLPPDVLPDDLRDDDTGLIKDKYGRAGFLAQLDLSFSPDGYFTEGPYYLRYALTPFLLFGRALADKRPDLEVLNYRDGILKKAVFGLINQADPRGDFFPINDSQKGMSVYAPEVVKAVDYAYFYFGEDPGLLSLAEEQGSFTLDAAGVAVAKAIAAGKARPFRPASVAFTDGAQGTEGGVGVLRAYGEDGTQTCLVMKYSAQGMGHGHFDKLSYSLYNDDGEIIQDYGAARWVNIDQKGGGRYLPENNSWAKQSIAHNTLVVDETSHYAGDIRIAERHHPSQYGFLTTDSLQLISAYSDNAYSGRTLHRFNILFTAPAFAQPLLIDVFRSRGDRPVNHDLPTWYHGQLLETDFPYRLADRSAPLGDEYGYQHLWLEAVGKPTAAFAKVNWLHAGRFYTQAFATEPGDEIRLVRLGANDPNFNLRRDPAFVLHRPSVSSTTFASILETHGSYSPREEIPRTPYGSLGSLSLLPTADGYAALRFTHTGGDAWLLLLAFANADPQAEHELTINGRTARWRGIHHLIKTD